MAEEKSLKELSRIISGTGLNVLGSAANAAGAVLGENLAGQLFDNYVPLERYTEYQRTYNWEIVFPYTIGNVPGPIVSKYCKAISFSDYNFEEIAVQRRGPKNYYIPGQMEINTATAVFLVPAPNLLQRFFSAWKSYVVSAEGNYGEQNIYKRTVYVRLYTTQGITSGTIKMKGAFPKTYPEYELSYETENIIRYTIVFCFDDIEFEGFDIASSIPRILKKLF